MGHESFSSVDQCRALGQMQTTLHCISVEHGRYYEVKRQNKKCTRFKMYLHMNKREHCQSCGRPLGMLLLVQVEFERQVKVLFHPMIRSDGTLIDGEANKEVKHKLTSCYEPLEQG